MKNINILSFASVFFVAIISLFIITGCETVRGTPEHALVYLDHTERVYIPPTYLEDNLIDPYQYELLTIGEARNNGYKPHADAQAQSYFMQWDRGLFGLLLQKIGVIKPLPSRWNEDGTWNW